MNKVKNVIKNIVFIVLRKKYIVFESVPDCGDNSKAVFDEMVRRGINKKYVLVWLLSGARDDFPSIHNVKYVKKDNKQRKWYITRAKCFICCNGFVYTDNPKQKSFFLTHGMYVKCPTAYYKLPDQIEYCLSSSEQMKQVQADALGTDVKKMFSLGYPRNDVLTAKPIDLHRYFHRAFDKIIVWYPTFRQHSSGMGTGSTHSIPIIWDEKSAIELNECARKVGVIIVLKPHFAQDMSKIQSLKLSNILLINDRFFLDNDITSYEFIGSCDALITDYSSVYFDYTLCDKPIGLVWEDYKDYEKNPGFALDMEYYMKGGVKIFDLEQFKGFVIDVAVGIDRLKNERREIRDVSNYSVDGKSSIRVVDYIVKEAGL